MLRPSGWAGFQVSDDPAIHRRRGGLRALGHRALAGVGRAPKGSDHPAWLGSAVALPELERVADAAGMDVERITGEGTQFCLVTLRRRDSGS